MKVTTTSPMTSFEEFWPFYLGEHRLAATRRLHLVGTSCGVVLALLALATRTPALLLAGLVCGYAFAWVGHFFVEHNRPATFQHPLWSFRGDFHMLALALRGKLDGELARLQINT